MTEDPGSLRLLSWNLYSHELHEMKFMPPPPHDYFKEYPYMNGRRTKSLITGRTPTMCLYDHRRATTNTELYNATGEHPEKSCYLKSLQRRDEYWTFDPPGQETCEPTDATVKYMEWSGPECLMSLPVETVHRWQTARNATFETCLKNILNDVPVMCFQEVDTSNFAMLERVRDSNLDLVLHTDLQSWRCDRWGGRGLALLYDSARINQRAYFEVELGKLPCTQCFSFDYGGKRFWLCNIHMYVQDHSESYIVRLLKKLKRWFPEDRADSIFIMAGDMNMRTRMKSGFLKTEPKSKEEPLDHILINSSSNDVIQETSYAIPQQLDTCIKSRREIAQALDALDEELRQAHGGGELVDRREYRHWVSDHQPLVVKLFWGRGRRTQESAREPRRRDPRRKTPQRRRVKHLQM